MTFLYYVDVFYTAYLRFLLSFCPSDKSNLKFQMVLSEILELQGKAQEVFKSVPDTTFLVVWNQSKLLLQIVY